MVYTIGEITFNPDEDSITYKDTKYVCFNCIIEDLQKEGKTHNAVIEMLDIGSYPTGNCDIEDKVYRCECGCKK